MSPRYLRCPKRVTVAGAGQRIQPNNPPADKSCARNGISPSVVFLLKFLSKRIQLNAVFYQKKTTKNEG